MDLKLGMNRSLDLRTELKLSQCQLVARIELAHLMSVPDEALSLVAGAITLNPQKVEEVLSSDKKQKKDCFVDEKVRSIYSGLVPIESESTFNKSSNQGLIISPNLKSLEQAVGQYEIRITPDVTYVGRRDEKPEIVYSDHIVGATGLFMIQIDSNLYPETAKLLGRLKNFDDWKKQKLRESYLIFGEKQREFFMDLDYGRLNLFRPNDLANQLYLNQSTISRLLSGRWMECRSVKGDRLIMNSKDLFFNKDDILKYKSLPLLNDLMEREFQELRAFSDQELSEKANHLARRTIAKYRAMCNVPNQSQRNKVYLADLNQEPYKFYV